MKIKLVYVDLFVGEVRTEEHFDPRPGDCLTVHVTDWERKEKDLVYRIIKKDYRYHGVVPKEGRTIFGDSDYLVLHVDPANSEAQNHLKMLLKEKVGQPSKKKLYTITCPECARDMIKMHETKGVETWRCVMCQQDVIQSREAGIIEVLLIPPGQA
jgi:hypothetical protein